tara:strand:- start:2626 stop:3420 length:795 start_codon:yes stop_codon:yes gene_type:complete
MDFGGQRKVKQKPLLPEGDHLAICYMITDLGTQEVKVAEKFGGGTKPQGKVEFAFEFPEYKAVYNDEKGQQVMSHWVMQTKSFYGSSRLKIMLESWSKKKIGANDKVDLSVYLGRACMITIEHNPDKNGLADDDTGSTIVWQNMTNFPTKLSDADREAYAKKGFLKGDKKTYPTENEKSYFDLGKFDQDVFDKIFPFKQKKIAGSPEFEALVANGKAILKEQSDAKPQAAAVAQPVQAQPAQAAPMQSIAPDIDEEEDEDEISF